MTFLQGSGEGDKCALVKDTHPPGGQSHCPGDRIHQEPSLGRVHGRGVEVTRETRPRPSVSRQQQQQPQPHVGGTTPPAGQQSALVRGGHVFPSPPALTSPWREMRFQLSAPSEKTGSVLPADPAQQADAKRPRVSPDGEALLQDSRGDLLGTRATKRPCPLWVWPSAWAGRAGRALLGPLSFYFSRSLSHYKPNLSSRGFPSLPLTSIHNDSEAANRWPGHRA